MMLASNFLLNSFTFPEAHFQHLLLDNHLPLLPNSNLLDNLNLAQESIQQISFNIALHLPNILDSNSNFHNCWWSILFFCKLSIFSLSFQASLLKACNIISGHSTRLLMECFCHIIRNVMTLNLNFQAILQQVWI